MNTDDVSGIASLLRPSFTHLGIDLVDVQWSGRGRGAVLRLVIDRANGGGVTLDDCERASNTASAVLDASDPIDHPYRLEVSSPGAERPIRRAEEWTAAVGRRVNVRLRDGDSELVLEGRLVSATGDAAEIEVRDRRSTRAVAFPIESVVSARIVVDI
jgi:ribosome maturation factor RimP